MTDAWHETQQAIRALRKGGDIRPRLIEAYRSLVRIRGKDLPNEVRHDHEWLIGAINTRSTERVCAEIRARITAMTPDQLSESVHRIVALHEALGSYQPAMPPTRQKQAACRALREKEGQAASDSNTGVDYSQCRLF